MAIKKREEMFVKLVAALMLVGTCASEVAIASAGDTLTIEVKLDDHFPQGEKQHMYFYFQEDGNQINGLIGDGLTFTVTDAESATMWMYWSDNGAIPTGTPPVNPPSDMHYPYRIQLIELTFKGASPDNTCDISCVDYYGLPVELSWGTQQKASFGSNTDADIRKKLLSASASSSEVNIANNGAFMRIVAPVPTPSTDYMQYYPDPTPYVDSIWTTHGAADWPGMISTNCPNSSMGQGCYLRADGSWSYSFTAKLIGNTGTGDWTHIQLTGNLGLVSQSGTTWPIITGTAGDPSSWKCDTDHVTPSDVITLTLPKASFKEFFYQQGVDLWTGDSGGTPIDMSLAACPSGTYSAQQACADAITSLGMGFSLGMVDSINSVAMVSTNCADDRWFRNHPGGALKVGELSSQEWKRCFSYPSENWGPGKPYYNEWASAIYDLSQGTVYGSSVTDHWKAADPLAVKPINGTNPLVISINSITTSPTLPSSSDVNGDGVVDADDLIALMNELGFMQHDSDFDHDVDGADLGTLLGSWGPYGKGKP